MKEGPQCPKVCSARLVPTQTAINFPMAKPIEKRSSLGHATKFLYRREKMKTRFGERVFLCSLGSLCNIRTTDSTNLVFLLTLSLKNEWKGASELALGESFEPNATLHDLRILLLDEGEVLIIFTEFYVAWRIR